ncbi:P27 family phage terminase small subunit [Gordonia sp. DT101]|uniref:P27 family phage terminase small subunit n=1 Tax=Gordonia sp. DT101 TaxID=3416545 RepID=UPI003CEE8347
MTKTTDHEPAPLRAHTGAEMTAHYLAEASRLGLVLDDADEMLLGQLADTVDTIAEFQASIDDHGAMTTTATGKIERNPATVEIRAQRTTLLKIVTLIDRRFAVAAAGGVDHRNGVKPGTIRGPYLGDGGRRANPRRPQRTPRQRRA